MTTTTLPKSRDTILTEEILQRCLERAPVYDRESRFFQEDFDELRDAGYLLMAVPQEFGGLGMSMAEVMRETRRLAYYAHADALALNMHVYWTGLAADMWRSGDKSLQWLLEAAGKGEVFAAGHAEPGNDLPVLLSTAKAERVDGGYRFTGRKNFGSLGPAWTWLGAHAMDTSDPASPKVVHAFIPRNAAGLRTEENWDVLGMRATQSHDTVLDGVFVPDDRVVRVVAAGAAGMDNFILGIFMWALPGFANVYYGMAQRALDLTVEGLQKRKAIALPRGYAYHPEYQHAVAEMVMELEAIGAHVEKVAQEWSDGVDHGAGWPLKVVAMKHRAVEGAWKIVDTALDLSGGFGIFQKSGIERLFRDARLGRIHPANSALSHEFVAKLTLGINPDDSPRWG